LAYLDPIPIISLAISISSTAYKAFKELSKNGVLIDSSATVDWENGLFEQQWKLQNKLPRHAHLWNLLERFTTIPNVVEGECIVFPSGQQIEALSKEDNLLKIDWRKICQVDKQQTITIRFKTPFDNKMMYRSLCDKYVNRIPEFIAKGTYALIFSVMLNRADLLMNDFNSVYYTNIVLPYDIGIDKKIMENALPDKLKENLISVSRYALMERRDALQVMSTLNLKITDLQKQELKDILHSFVKIDSPYGNAHIRSITCKVSRHVIGDGYPLFLPDSIHVEIVCSIDAIEQAIKGRIIFDLNELEKFIADTLTNLYAKSSKLGL
jgi:hypothetical protein